MKNPCISETGFCPFINSIRKPTYIFKFRFSTFENLTHSLLVKHSTLYIICLLFYILLCFRHNIGEVYINFECAFKNPRSLQSVPFFLPFLRCPDHQQTQRDYRLPTGTLPSSLLLIQEDTKQKNGRETTIKNTLIKYSLF